MSGYDLADLATAFPHDKVSIETLRLYKRELADLPADVLEAAVRETMRTSRRFPSLADLRSVAAEYLLGLPTESEALASVERRLAWVRDKTGEKPPVHPLVLEAAEHIGGMSTFRSTDAPSVIRGQFLNIYRDLRSRAVREAQVRPQGHLDAGDGWVAIEAPRPTGQSG